MTDLSGMYGVDPASSNAFKKADPVNYISNPSDLDAALSSQGQDFKTMLDGLTLKIDNGVQMDDLSRLMSSGQNNDNGAIQSISQGIQSAYMYQQNIADLQKLSSVVGRSKLIGEEIIYADRRSNAFKVGVVERLVVSMDSSPYLLLTDGTQVALGDVRGRRE